ncbi:MAG: TfoX/Sxy family protein [Anaerolineae bacterium]|nr:TfoX/Sxy family protein [Anaerolineae bacterium]
MSASKAYCDAVKAQLSPFMPVTSRAMFGGYGLYSDGVIFALITSDDVLHFKVDDSNRALYEDAGMQQFHNMPYFQVASDWYDNPEKLYELARQSVEVSKRGKKKK